MNETADPIMLSAPNPSKAAEIGDHQVDVFHAGSLTLASMAESPNLTHKPAMPIMQTLSAQPRGRILNVSRPQRESPAGFPTGLSDTESFDSLL